MNPLLARILRRFQHRILRRAPGSAPTPDAPTEANRAVLVALLCQVFLIMLGMGLVGPILPLYASSFGVSAAAVGMLVTAFGIARFITNMPAGALAERIGRK
ncbi:MAG: MFS transporter, partial [Chloroflexota bacterium]